MNLQILRNKLSLKSNRAATMVEYGLMLALILVIAYTAFSNLGKAVSKAATSADTAFKG